MSDLHSKITDKDMQRFADKCALPDNLEDVSRCWFWRGAKHSKKRAYGKFRLGGAVMNAHKASYIIFNGDVDEGLVVAHLCNCESCVNPAHLAAQTQSENMRYCVQSGRHNSQH
jgi:hypothetical protein